MTRFSFTDAVRERLPLRMFLDGPTGSGKTWVMLAALYAAQQLHGGEVGVIDTEGGSARLYAGDDGPFPGFTFKHLDFKPPYDPDLLTEAVTYCLEQGFTAIGVDSWSHFWAGAGGTLAKHDEHTKLEKGNSFSAWRRTNPIYERMLTALAQSPAHVICTARSKMGYEVEQSEGGKTKVVKLGLQPIMRDAAEYEFSICGSIDLEHNLIITKTRCPFLVDKVVNKPTPDFFTPVLEWFDAGAEAAKPLDRAMWNALVAEAAEVGIGEKSLKDYVKTTYGSLRALEWCTERDADDIREWIHKWDGSLEPKSESTETNEEAVDSELPLAE